jgi:hypothetical protein
MIILLQRETWVPGSDISLCVICFSCVFPNFDVPLFHPFSFSTSVHHCSRLYSKALRVSRVSGFHSHRNSTYTRAQHSCRPASWRQRKIHGKKLKPSNLTVLKFRTNPEAGNSQHQSGCSVLIEGEKKGGGGGRKYYLIPSYCGNVCSVCVCKQLPPGGHSEQQHLKTIEWASFATVSMPSRAAVVI